MRSWRYFISLKRINKSRKILKNPQKKIKINNFYSSPILAVKHLGRFYLSAEIGS